MIYFDNAATTRILPEVLESMMPYLTENYGNPSSFYDIGKRSKQALEQSRESVAKLIGAKPEEVCFTSCGSESDNWAIQGAARLGQENAKKHIISSQIEHHAVLHTLKSLEQEGFEVTFLPVSDDGLVDTESLKCAIREDTCLVTIMFANNEIGTIQPIKQISEICGQKQILFHTDAVQAFGSVEIDVNQLGIDMLSVSGHKVHAPKGVGALYIRSGVKIPNFIHGGNQEFGRRAGTENVASIVGFGKAVEILGAQMSQKNQYILGLRNQLLDHILSNIPKSRLNGDRDKRLPGNINVSFEGIEGESILLMLQRYGICVSTGSACTSGSLEPSHVLLAMGLSPEIAHGSLRITLSKLNTQQEIDEFKKVLPNVIAELRNRSPIWAG